MRRSRRCRSVPSSRPSRNCSRNSRPRRAHRREGPASRQGPQGHARRDVADAAVGMLQSRRQRHGLRVPLLSRERCGRHGAPPRAARAARLLHVAGRGPARAVGPAGRRRAGLAAGHGSARSLGAWTDVDAARARRRPAAAGPRRPARRPRGAWPDRDRGRRSRRTLDDTEADSVGRLVTGGAPVPPRHARRRVRAPRFRRRRRRTAAAACRTSTARRRRYRAAPATTRDASLRAALRDRRTHRRFAAGADPGRGPRHACSASRSACRHGRTPAKAAWRSRPRRRAVRGTASRRTCGCGASTGYPQASITTVPARMRSRRLDDRGRARLGDVVVAGTARLRRRGGRRRAVVGTGARGVALPERARVPCRADRVRPPRADVLPGRHRARARAVLYRSTRGHGHRSATSGSTAGCSRRCTWSVRGASCAGRWQPHAGQPAPRLEITELGRALGRAGHSSFERTSTSTSSREWTVTTTCMGRQHTQQSST